jgi:hypothetical protein
LPSQGVVVRSGSGVPSAVAVPSPAVVVAVVLSQAYASPNCGFFSGKEPLL